MARLKPYERRAAGAYPFFKLATWDPISATFREGRGSFATEAQAREAAAFRGRGRYRISTVTDQGRSDAAPFDL